MWCAKLSDSQRDAMRALIKAQPEAGPALVAALEALELARWDDLPEATLPWERVARAGLDTGVSARPTSCGISPPAAAACSVSR